MTENPGPRLVAFTRSGQQPELYPGDSLVLDREFLTGANDDDRFHARNPPVVFYGLDSWYVDNRTPDQALVLYGPTGRVDRIEAKTGRSLEVGDSVLLIVDLEVGFEADSLDLPTKGTHRTIPAPAVKITDSPELEVDLQLRDWLDERPIYRTITYTRFQQYVLPLERARERGHSNRPRYLSSQEVIRCYPDVTLVQVNEANRHIRSITGLELHEIGPWMASRGLLLEKNNIDIPHVNCGH